MYNDDGKIAAAPAAVGTSSLSSSLYSRKLHNEPQERSLSARTTFDTQVGIAEGIATNNYSESASDAVGNLCPGARVDVSRGKYKGRIGLVTKLTPQKAWVDLDGSAKPVALYQDQLRVLTMTASSSGSLHPSSHAADATPQIKADMSFSSRVTEEANLGRAEQDSLATTVSCTSEKLDVVPSNLVTVNGHESECLALEESSTFARTFASHLFQGRLLEKKLPWTTRAIQHPNLCSFDSEGRHYELFSAKVLDSEEASPFWFSSARGGGGAGGRRAKAGSKILRLRYVAVDGPNMRPINLQQTLESIADFVALPSRKVVSRLELFDTPAMTPKNSRSMLVTDLIAADFEEIPEEGHEGCGFIPRAFLERFFGSSAVGKRTLAIQVRVFCPSLGIFKGMLMEKPDIVKIQLPASMKKVGRSRRNHDQWACLVIKGSFPSTINNFINRKFEVRSKDPPKSAQKPTKPADMVTRLWKGAGVPADLIEGYCRICVSYDHLRHASVVGVIDPTGYIPEGHVFITGMGTQYTRQDKMFVTRYPCMTAQDWHLITTLRQKPSGMPMESWEWLRSLSFGAIVFPLARNGALPMPNSIAKGDLDGDLYFVCWHREIFERISSCPASCPSAYVLAEAATLEVERKEAEPPTRGSWLKQAQLMMTDLKLQADLQKLIGTLYYASMRASKSHLGPDDPDAVAFGGAYAASLDLKKHGGKVKLPLRLWEKIDNGLHDYLDPC